MGSGFGRSDGLESCLSSGGGGCKSEERERKEGRELNDFSRLEGLKVESGRNESGRDEICTVLSSAGGCWGREKLMYGNIHGFYTIISPQYCRNYSAMLRTTPGLESAQAIDPAYTFVRNSEDKHHEPWF